MVQLPVEPVMPFEFEYEGVWSSWDNRDTIGGSGDWETLEAHGQTPCENPIRDAAESGAFQSITVA